jgi:hypothetical protein
MRNITSTAAAILGITAALQVGAQSTNREENQKKQGCGGERTGTTFAEIAKLAE